MVKEQRWDLVGALRYSCPHRPSFTFGGGRWGSSLRDSLLHRGHRRWRGCFRRDFLG